MAAVTVVKAHVQIANPSSIMGRGARTAHGAPCSSGQAGARATMILACVAQASKTANGDDAGLRVPDCRPVGIGQVRPPVVRPASQGYCTSTCLPGWSCRSVHGHACMHALGPAVRCGCVRTGRVGRVHDFRFECTPPSTDDSRCVGGRHARDRFGACLVGGWRR